MESGKAMGRSAKQGTGKPAQETAVAVIPGVISLQEIYTIEEAKARLRWTDSALRAAKRRGLRLLACGKRRYVSGQEVLRFLESLQAPDHTS
jgi:hypothetical protein